MIEPSSGRRTGAGKAGPVIDDQAGFCAFIQATPFGVDRKLNSGFEPVYVTVIVNWVPAATTLGFAGSDGEMRTPLERTLPRSREEAKTSALAWTPRLPHSPTVHGR